MKQLLVVAQKGSDILLLGSKVTINMDKQVVEVHDLSGKEVNIMTRPLSQVDYIEALENE